ncbi:PilW family protein [Paraferrimonas haliotis]|uniref:PilW family protein n=1 Tax=Paraferrimonas haliotis TaxID=2013866 RepID=UPI000BA98AEF|nr:PilW family protein [Paraferrimonas haliotis]
MNTQKGLTLVELMVAMLMALFLSAGLFTMFAMSAKNVTSTGQFAELQENARMALAIMSKDVSQTGFMADLNGVSLVLGSNVALSDTAISPDCTGGGYNNSSFPNAQPAHFRLIWGYTAGAGAGSMDCSSSAKSGTDVLQIKRLVGPDVDASSLMANQFYMVSNFNRGLFFKGGESPTPSVTDGRYWQYQHHVYYIENENRSGNVVPILKRRRLTSAGMVEESFVDGVEDMQVLYGVDNSGDGTADGYVSAANVNNSLWDRQDSRRIVSVSINLLLRSIEEDPEFSSQEFSYQVGLRTAQDFNDGYRRQVISSTIILENPALLNQS